MKKWRWVAVMLAAMAVTVVGFAQPASAGNGWQPCGWVCDDEDPNTYYAWDSVKLQLHLCGPDARTVATVMGTELRYSPSCETTWGRQVYSCSCHFLNLVIKSYRNGTVVVNPNVAESSPALTVMLDDHNYLNQVCVAYTDEESPPGYHEGCSSKF